jgi:hypothetical protein
MESLLSRIQSSLCIVFFPDAHVDGVSIHHVSKQDGSRRVFSDAVFFVLFKYFLIRIVDR